MRSSGVAARVPGHRPVPRGIAEAGPAVLSYGFRPFFLLAGLFAILDMILWIGALSGAWAVGGPAGPISWHAHEMLFGYGAAALGGFVLTAVPNWTGRLPVSGRPLLVLIGLWLAGRLAMAVPELFGTRPGAVLDSLFLLALGFVVGREVIAGRNWKNLRVAVAIGVLGLLNVAFHLLALAGEDQSVVVRLTVSVFMLLIAQVGGRIVPSFTRNFLARQGAVKLPRPLGRLDEAALLATLAAGLAWSAAPQGALTAALAALAALLQAVRLAGWRGWATFGEPLLAVLHAGYGFLVLGLAAVAAAALGLVAQPSALHVLTVGGVGLMTLAVMTRATRGHTGRPLTASWATALSYLCVVAVALLRPLAELLPAYYHLLLEISAVAWIAAYVLFVAEHGPMLLGASRRTPR